MSMTNTFLVEQEEEKEQEMISQLDWQHNKDLVFEIRNNKNAYFRYIRNLI